MKLVSVKKSDRDGKKYVAEFLLDTGRTKTIHFGASGFTDYTLNATDEQREHYLTRHKKEDWNNPTTAGALSRWLLWGNSHSLQTNITAFKRRFHL